MSSFSNDSLGTVVNTEGGGGARATTPQMKRTTSRRQRQTTPQRAGSAPRASSVNKTSALAKACFESQSCNRSLSRTAGRKKQQKWENDNLFGLNMFMKKVDALNKQHYNSDEDDDEDEGVSQGLSFNWQSLFGTLTDGEHEDALETYLKCSNSYRVQEGKGESQKCIRDCCSEWERAEFAWLKVEKRLRTILLQALAGGGKEDTGACGFITAVEALLLSLEQEADSGGGGVLPTATAATAHLFTRPPRLVQPLCATHSREEDKQHINDDDGGDSVIISVASPHLVVTLLDSPFHRLLLHATCQFHHMHSKSFTDKSKKQKQKSGGSVRATRITPFQSKHGAHSIALVPFVLLKLSTLEDNRRDKQTQINGNMKGKRMTNKSPQQNKENSPVNNAFSEEQQFEGKKQEEQLPVIGLEALTLANKCVDKEEEEEDEEEEDEEEEEEYCLVDIVNSSASSSTSNPIESREN